MGDITDFVNGFTGLANSDLLGLEGAESAIKALIGSVEAVNTTKTILMALGIFQKTDDIAAAVKELKAAFDVAIARSDEHSTMNAIAPEIGRAETALQNLRDLAPEDPSEPGDINWEAVRGDTLDAPLDALNALKNDTYWNRVFFPEGVYSDSWADQPYTPPHDNYVFDYRYTLPAYMEATTIWLTTRLAMVKLWSNQDSTRVELQNRADFLQGIYGRIRDGIRTLFPPRFWQVQIAANGTSVWQDRGRLFGAVEIYSTFRIVDRWPEQEYPLKSTDYIRFVIRHQIRTHARWKSVYQQIGVASVARMITHLRSLVGVYPAGVDGRTDAWSMRELGQDLAALAQWIAADPARAGLDRDELSRTFADIPGSGFGAVQSLSLRKLLGVLRTFGPEPYSSLRAALAQ